MNLKRLIGFTILIAAVIVMSITIRHALYGTSYSEINPPAALGVGTTTASSVVNSNVEDEKPARLIIPAIKVDAAVQYVGLKADGSMGTPSNFTDVAWYKLGTIPGELGSAVIDGHVDNALSLAGVFKHLEDLKVGDDIYVRRKDGVELHFRVTDMETYDYKNAPSEKIFETQGGRYLNLITCSGTWVGSQHSYTTRLVVYTELVS